MLQRFNHLLHRTKKVEFIEQFSEKLLVKQARAIARIDMLREAGMRMACAWHVHGMVHIVALLLCAGGRGPADRRRAHLLDHTRA